MTVSGPYSATLLAESENELHRSQDWYEEQREGLGRDFTRAVQASMNHVKSNPYLFQVRSGEVRFARLERFPFVIVYRVTQTESVRVLAVFHTRRNPTRLQTRLTSRS